MSESDQRRVQEAVSRAEKVTSGEIVPYVVGRSGQYTLVRWKAAALGAALFVAMGLLIGTFYTGWGLAWIYTAWGITGLMLVGAAVGGLASLHPAVLRPVTGRQTMQEQAHARALAAFVQEEIFRTRDRTGILLFVSMLERHIEVIGDEGINRRVDLDEWIDVVDLVRSGIRSGALADGLVSAIDRCGSLLERCKVEIRPDDTDELSNRIRLSDT